MTAQGSAPLAANPARRLDGRIAHRGPRRVQGRWRSSWSRSASRVLLNHVIVEVQDDDPLDLRRDLPRARAEPARRPGRSAPASAAAPLPRWLAILVAYILFLVGFIFLVLQRDPADRARGRAARLAAAHLRQGLRGTGRTTTSSSASSTTSTTSPSCSRSEAVAAAGEARRRRRAAKEITVGILNNIVEAVVVLTLTFFLLLDGGRQFQRAHRPPAPSRERDRVRRIGIRIAGIVRSYVSVNLLLAGARRHLHLARARAARGRARGPARGPGRLPRPRAADRVHGRRAAGRGRRRRCTTSPTALIDLARSCSSSTSRSRTG